MNNKRYKSAMFSIVGLMVLAGGLFVYQNFYLAKQQQANESVIYLAKQNLQANAVLSPSMFQGVRIASDSVLPGEVQNMNQITGKQLKGGLLKGEVLFTQRLESANTKSQGTMQLQVASDFPTNAQVNDTVDVFVQITNPQTNQVKVEKLFTKRVVSVSGNSGSVLSGSQSNPIITVDATAQDVENYLIAKQSGKIDVVVDGSLDPSSSSSTSNGSNATQFNPSDATASSSSSTGTNSKAQSVMTYQVQKGDTIGSIALKFKTSTMDIATMNHDKTTFKPGEQINVPAN